MSPSNVGKESASKIKGLSSDKDSTMKSRSSGGTSRRHCKNFPPKWSLLTDFLRTLRYSLESSEALGADLSAPDLYFQFHSLDFRK
ncbi:hypothetical protein TMatcc_001306 [Talaromyces marneffei ATCC 18224]